MERVLIEIKARCSDQDSIRDILKLRNAEFKGLDHQVDTYFNVERGRLKLREGNIENHLIYYEREDKKGPKQSNVILFQSDPNSSLKEILTKSLGILVVVDKKREIYFIENVKFHLDALKNLGTFVEIEAIDADGSIGKEQLLKQCQSYLDLFKIPNEDMISGSYSDMLLKK
ncbi:class IV adenylate cyclase [Candidatus Woesearchaeota archaeon]|nr:class IV adenylate cyclase [Candidatus Woesearchaeota archaeon]